MGFWQSQVNLCLFIQGSLMLLVYINICIVFLPAEKCIDIFVKELKQRFVIMNKGDIMLYLGIQVDKLA